VRQTPLLLRLSSRRQTAFAGQHQSVMRLFDMMHSASVCADTSSICHAISSSMALGTAAVDPPSRLHWMQQARRYFTLSSSCRCVPVYSCGRRLFDVACDHDCSLSTASVSLVFEACSRLASPIFELDTVYKRFISTTQPEEKLFLNYVRCRLCLSSEKVPALVQDVVSDMGQASPPIQPFIKLFNIALSFCSIAHDAAKVGCSSRGCSACCFSEN
jgi:hypothetical protein